ncbi:exodeoxyribonuclease VII large subunit [Paenibacillus sp. GXUN7292]|uniref:exodeoxyribonuclease VII large subunit n=1 Tax=Paenibacillus sp. GXUN7292 TaxID=3422499 RepID=UPI003D7F1243
MANQPHIYSIKEINKYVRMKMESDALLSDVWLRGEISNFVHHSSGHMYFTLKDKDSKLKSVMFASYNTRLPFIPKEGTKVLARGSINVFERDGTYQFYATAMQPDGKGSLYLAYEQLKNRLDEEGLFAAARKRAIPVFPRSIGIVTSPTGAAVQDIITTLQRRYPVIPIYIYPVLVQGKQAAPSIAAAIDAMNRHSACDVLIIGRGGGSLEELWAFNEEIVARSIAASQIPVISAVGHETDFTIADFVADLRAATPTAAAELAVPHLLELKQQRARAEQRLQLAMKALIQANKEKLTRLKRSPFFMQPRKYMLDQTQRLDRLTEQLEGRTRQLVKQRYIQLAQQQAALAGNHPGAQVLYLKKQLEGFNKRMNNSIHASLKENKLNLTGKIKQLDALSPLKVMARGYSLVYDELENHIIGSIDQVQDGDKVKVKLSDGQLDCVVQSKRGEPHGRNND